MHVICYSAQIWCLGGYSCADATLTVGSTNLFGDHAAKNSIINGSHSVYAYGYQAAANAFITYEGASSITVDATGYESFQNGYLKCPASSTCTLSCNSRSCKGATIDCSAVSSMEDCIVTCDGNNKQCPDVIVPYTSYSDENGNLSKCKKQDHCFVYDGSCHAKDIGSDCPSFVTKDECIQGVQSNYCNWSKGNCVSMECLLDSSCCCY